MLKNGKEIPMKRVFAIVLTAGLLLCLCACADEPQVTTEPPKTTVPTTVPATTAGAKDPQMGDFADGTYSNDFLGICCKVSEEWTVYSAVQLGFENVKEEKRTKPEAGHLQTADGDARKDRCGYCRAA